MNNSHSDALVFFGATGDLAYKKIFPALQAMVKRGTLNAPVIGVAKAGWNLDQLKARAKDSLEKHGGLDPVAFEKLCGLLRYVDGDYGDAATFQALRASWDPRNGPRITLPFRPPCLARWWNIWRKRDAPTIPASSLKSLLAGTSFPRGTQRHPAQNVRRGGDFPH
jgi:hypothetical protein